MFYKWINEPQKRCRSGNVQGRDSGNAEHIQHINPVMETREWLAIMTLMLIPGVNIILLLKWAFSNKEMEPATKVNFARATIIMIVTLAIAAAMVTGIYLLALNIQDTYQ